MINLLVFVISFAFVIFLYWLGGNEFVRGPDLQALVVVALIVSGLVVLFRKMIIDTFDS